MKHKVLAVIPARLESRRFPRRPLALIGGKTLVEHLYREASKSKLINRVVVASDSKEIIQTVERFGGEAVKTLKKHKTGSDRTAEVARNLGGSIILNIQADHLGPKAADYDRVIKTMLSSAQIKYATLSVKVKSEDDLYNPNVVKVITDSVGNAIWFSRYPLPYLQGVDNNRLKRFNFYHHVGVYFFRNSGLRDFTNWSRSLHEKAESLEQLRILENRKKIVVFKIKRDVFPLDTSYDLKLLSGFNL